MMKVKSDQIIDIKSAKILGVKSARIMKFKSTKTREGQIWGMVNLATKGWGGGREILRYSGKLGMKIWLSASFYLKALRVIYMVTIW